MPLVLFHQPVKFINKEHGQLSRWLTDTRLQLTLALQAPLRDIQVEYKVTARVASEGEGKRARMSLGVPSASERPARQTEAMEDAGT